MFDHQISRFEKRIADLPGDYDVFPGHAEGSRLSIEREHNPYMRHAIENL